MAVVGGASAGLTAAPRATIIQLRAPGLSTRALEREANELLASASVPVLVSSRCDVALACGAAGVNLPESDITVADARTLLGRRLVGRSVHSIDGAQQAEREGADFIIFGPVWQSTSHPGTPPVGVAALELVARSVQIPVLAIGGVTEDRIVECHAAGAAGYAAIGMFTSAQVGRYPAKPGGGEPRVVAR
jgi:thiamine-phosphate diphosphorylase